MKKFSRSIHGYNVNEVNRFVDDVIRRVEAIIKEEESIKKELLDKDAKIKELETTIENHKNIERELNSRVNISLDERDYIKKLAISERDAIINDARKNANRIISDALIRAEKTQYEAELLKKNVNLFKSRVRVMLNQQLDLIDDLDKEIL